MMRLKERINFSFRDNSDSLCFAKDSFLLVITGVVVGLFNLLLHPIVGRRMGDIPYAEFVSLMALLNILTVPAMTLTTVMARFVAEYAYGNAVVAWVTVVRRAMRRIAILGTAFFVVWSLLSGFLRDILNAPSQMSLIILGAIAFIRLFRPIVRGTLQGSKRFGWMAVSRIGSALFQIIFALLAVNFFSGVTSVMIAVLGATVLAVLLGCWPFCQILKETKPLSSYDTQHIYAYLGPVFLSQVALFVLMNADLALSIRYLDGIELKAYPKAATLARTVLFVAQPIAIVMFPRAVVSPRLRLIVGPLLFSFIISFIVALTLFFFPSLALQAMYGMSGPIHESLLRRYVWAVLPLTSASLIAQYLWARNKIFLVLCLLPVGFAYLIQIMFYQHDAKSIISALCLWGWIGLGILCAITFLKIDRSKSSL